MTTGSFHRIISKGRMNGLVGRIVEDGYGFQHFDIPGFDWIAPSSFKTKPATKPEIADWFLAKEEEC